MRFSTRKRTRKAVGIAALAGAAVLGIGGVVNYLNKNEAQAATSSNMHVYYARRADYNSTATPNAAAADAAAALRVGQAAFCNLGNADNEYTVTRVNPYTGQNDSYWVFADTSENCATVSGDEMLLNDNGATVLDSTRTYENTSFYGRYQNQFGGTLGAFHIVAFYNAQAQVQAYGNVATRYLDSTGNNNVAHFEVPTLSYIQDINPDAKFSSFNNVAEDDNDSSVLVVGEDVNVRRSQNVGYWEINGQPINSPTKSTKADGSYADNVWQEYDGGVEFLDFKQLKTDAVYLNERIRGLVPTMPADPDNPTADVNIAAADGSAFIRIANDSGANVINIDAGLLTSTGTKVVPVWGFDQHKDATLIVNVDMANVEPDANGVKNIEVNQNWMVCYDDASKLDSEKYGNQGSREPVVARGTGYCVNQQWFKDKFPNHIIFNYYDSTAPAYTYVGATDSQSEYYINYSKGMTAVTVAPRGDVEVSVTPYQGVIIANNVEMVSGDSYFLSLSDNLPIFNNACHYKVHHYIKGTTTKVADDENYGSVTCNEEVSIAADATAISSGGYLVDSAYNTTNTPATEIAVTADTPYSTTLTDITVDYDFTIYYDKNCEVDVRHIDADTGSMIGNFGTEYVESCYANEGNGVYHIFGPLDSITDMGYVFIEGEYVSEEDSAIVYQADDETESVQTLIGNGDKIESGLMPVGVWNDQPLKTINLYYRTPHKVYVTHCWADDTNCAHPIVARTADNQDYFKGDSYNHSGDVLNQDTYHWASYSVDSNHDAASGTVNTSDIEIVFLYTRNSYNVYTTHCWADDADCENPIVARASDGSTYHTGDPYQHADDRLDQNTYGWTSYFVDPDNDDANGYVGTRDIEIIFYYVRPVYHLYITHCWADDADCEDPIVARASDGSTYRTGDSYQHADDYLDKDAYGWTSYEIDSDYDTANGSIENRDIEIVFRYTKEKTPETSTGKTPIAFSVAGASVALGAILFIRARRS